MTGLRRDAGPAGAAMRRRLRAACALFMLAFVLVAQGEAPVQPTVELRQARFAIGDYDGRFGDASQRVVTLPHAWEVTNPGATGDGWYTLEWTLDTLPTTPQALCMTALTMPTEVYLNGELVGASGRLNGRRPRSYEQSRYIDIPAGLLRLGTNYLGVHVRAREPDIAGLGPVLTGEAPALRERAREVLFVHTIGPAAISIATLTVGVFIFLLWLRRREPGYALFSGAVVLWSLHTLVSLAPEPLLPQPHWTVLWTAAYLLFVAMLCLFCIRFAGVRWPKYERFVLVYAAATIPALYAANEVNAFAAASSLIRLGGIALVVAALIAVARYAIRRWNVESALLLVAGAVSAVFALHDWLAAQNPLALRPVWLVPYAALGFLTLFGYLLTDRFVRALNESELERRPRASRRGEERGAVDAAADHAGGEGGGGGREPREVELPRRREPRSAAAAACARPVFAGARRADTRYRRPGTGAANHDVGVVARDAVLGAPRRIEARCRCDHRAPARLSDPAHARSARRRVHA